MKSRALNSVSEAVSRHRIFKSFFGGGFECSTFKRPNGRRMDFVALTRHDDFAAQDYLRLQSQGLRVAREGARWHLIEPERGVFDFSSVIPIVEAARATSTQVVWDLCHFGWPDHVDIFATDFPARLAEYGRRFAEWLAMQTGGAGFFVPVNEISYFSWASGDEGSMYPFAHGRGFELKRNLVRGAIAAMEAILDAQPEAHFMQIDPVIHVRPFPNRPDQAEEAEAYRLSQYQAWDMLAGRLCPELGGKEEYLEVLGVNYYPHNQWYYNLKGARRVGKFRPIRRTNPEYRPFREILREVYKRYQRPIFVAETGAENRLRAGWLRYVCEEVDAAIDAGLPILGICLYPILNHPGWANDRHCHNALWDYCDSRGNRPIYAPLARELRKWRRHFEKKRPANGGFDHGRAGSHFQTEWESAARGGVASGK